MLEQIRLAVFEKEGASTAQLGVQSEVQEYAAVEKK
jgi:hypothetical protein